MLARFRSKDTWKKDLAFGHELFLKKEYSEAEDQFRNALLKQKEKLGMDHEVTLASLVFLGNALFEQKKYWQAGEAFRQSADRRERSLGKSNPLTLRSKYHLGCTLVELGEADEAEILLQELLPAMEAYEGKDSEMAIICNGLLGRARFLKRKFGKAEETIQDVVNCWKLKLGDYDTRTLENQHWLGKTYYMQSKLREAQWTFQETVRSRELILGILHPDTLTSKYWLGRTFWKLEKYVQAEETLQETKVSLETKLGGDHEATMSCSYWLASTFYELGMYEGAESLFRELSHKLGTLAGPQNRNLRLECQFGLGRTLCFRGEVSEARQTLEQAVQGYTAILGEHHQKTLDTKYWLARTLYDLEEFSEAESLIQQVVSQQWIIFGGNDDATLNKKCLNSMYHLGLTLFKQEKWDEACKSLHQVVSGMLQAFGSDHQTTIQAKCVLGKVLYEMNDYSEAQKCFQQTIQSLEKALGPYHIDTLQTKFWVGKTFHMQGMYVDARGVLEQTSSDSERELGKGHELTLLSKYWLGRTSYRLEQYQNSEELLQHVVDQREIKLGKGHEDVLWPTFWLGKTFYKQKKRGKAKDLIEYVLTEREKSLGKDHADTIVVARLFQKLQLSSGEGVAPQSGVIGRLNRAFLDREARKPYSDAEIYEISTLLRHLNIQWSKVPRTYIILRTIGHLDVLDEFIEVGFSDYWFPVTEKSLPTFLRPSVRAAFVDVQNLVLTKSMDLEKGEAGQHCYFQREFIPLETIKPLGEGRFGQVDRVLSLISYKEYARKRVSRRSAFRSRKLDDVKKFIAEIEILKRIKHRHVVEFVGSYTDEICLALIMSPVAEMDLDTYLRRETLAYGELRTFFGCLARGLEFLHDHKIRHKDIKPKNILVHRGRVLFADFGLSLDFTDADSSTTMSMVAGMTPRYSAPEVALHQSRNTMSDIWSLGVVFMEMILVLKGKKVDYMDEYLMQHGTKQIYVRSNLVALQELIAELEGTGESSDNQTLAWAQQMLSIEQECRPTASSLITLITLITPERGGRFCGICCDSIEEDLSD